MISFAAVGLMFCAFWLKTFKSGLAFSVGSQGWRTCAYKSLVLNLKAPASQAPNRSRPAQKKGAEHCPKFKTCRHKHFWASSLWNGARKAYCTCPTFRLRCRLPGVPELRKHRDTRMVLQAGKFAAAAKFTSACVAWQKFHRVLT